MYTVYIQKLGFSLTKKIFIVLIKLWKLYILDKFQKLKMTICKKWLQMDMYEPDFQNLPDMVFVEMNQRSCQAINMYLK